MYPNLQKNQDTRANYLGVTGLSIFTFTTVQNAPKYMNIHCGITYILYRSVQNPYERVIEYTILIGVQFRINISLMLLLLFLRLLWMQLFIRDGFCCSNPNQKS